MVKIAVFTCNWDGWSCIDAAAGAGLSYPASVSIIKLPCLSSINAGLLAKSFEQGIDGVLLLGCRAHECAHGQFGDNIEKEFSKAADILKLLGKGSQRLKLVKLEAFDGNGFVREVTGFIEALHSPTSQR